MLLPDGRLADCSNLAGDWAAGALDPDRIAALAAVDAATLPIVSQPVRFGSPVGSVRKIVAVGLNYPAHAGEAGMPTPDEPLFFLKAASAIVGPNDPIVIPKAARMVDWEVELAIVVGRKLTYASPAEATAAIAGYTILNDVSERDFQLNRGGQWTKGKSCDSFAPLGPWLVTPDEVGNPDDLALWLNLNDVRQQEGRTSEMMFDCATLLSEITHYLTLEPGDVVATGTPAGVGYSKNPQRFLVPGDVVEMGIETLGTQRQNVVAGPAN